MNSRPGPWTRTCSPSTDVGCRSYNLHKTLAGLLDAYNYAGSERALAIATALADWWLGISRQIPDETFEEILRTEFGGMNDSFAILAGISGRADHLAEAHRFSHWTLTRRYPTAG